MFIIIDIWLLLILWIIFYLPTIWCVDCMSGGSGGQDHSYWDKRQRRDWAPPTSPPSQERTAPVRKTNKEEAEILPVSTESCILIFVIVLGFFVYHNLIHMSICNKYNRPDRSSIRQRISRGHPSDVTNERLETKEGAILSWISRGMH